VALGEALASLDLDSELDPKEVQVAAAALVRRMQTNQDSYLVSLLGKALGNLSAKLDPEDVQAGASVLLQRMQTDQDNSDLIAPWRSVRQSKRQTGAKRLAKSGLSSCRGGEDRG